MNILLIIGNGFDKAQQLATSYQDFYHYISGLDSVSKLESELISSIQADYETWADLELGLGKYAGRFVNASEFLEVLVLLKRRLKTYLEFQESLIPQVIYDNDKIIRDLCDPSQYLEKTGRTVFQRALDASDQIINIRCVTYNYTRTFERLMGDSINEDSFLGNFRFPCYFQGLMHIHGTIDELMLLGLNDESQLLNEQFRTNADVLDEFIKPRMNDGCMNERNSIFQEWIENADVLVLFGVSIGETDNWWWKQIGLAIDSRRQPILLYFPYDTKKDTDSRQNLKLRWSTEYIEFLTNRMDIKTDMGSLSKRICVGINKDFLRVHNNLNNN